MIQVKQSIGCMSFPLQLHDVLWQRLMSDLLLPSRSGNQEFVRVKVSSLQGVQTGFCDCSCIWSFVWQNCITLVPTCTQAELIIPKSANFLQEFLVTLHADCMLLKIRTRSHYNKAQFIFRSKSEWIPFV